MGLPIDLQGGDGEELGLIHHVFRDLTVAMKSLNNIIGHRSLILIGSFFVCVRSSLVYGECGDYVVVRRPSLETNFGSKDSRSRFATTDVVYSAGETMNHSG